MVQEAKTNPATATRKRVFHAAEEYTKRDKFRVVQMTGGEHPPVADRTPGAGMILGNWLVQRPETATKHLIQLAEVGVGNRKYLHRHLNAETVWFIIEGEGEFYGGPDEVYAVKAGDVCHSLPGEWHGMGNTGTVPLRYLSVEGPQPEAGARSETEVME